MINKTIIENRLLWLCTRKDFYPAYQDKVVELLQQQEINWNLVYTIARRQKVAPIIITNLRKIRDRHVRIPQSILEKYKTFFSNHLNQRDNIKNDVRRIAGYFNNKSTKILLVKGVALTLTIYKNYPQYTPGDIDILLINKRENVSDEEDQADINFFNKLNTDTEWERFEHHDLSINGMIPVDFEMVWRYATPIKLSDNLLNVYTLCPEDTLFVACISSCRKRFFRLKSVCDIAEIINYYRNLNWNKIIHDAQRYHCQNIIYTALLVTKLTVGCQLPETIFLDLGVNPIRSFIIRNIVKYFKEHVLLLYLSLSEYKPKKISLSLLLVIATYTWFQVWRRISYVFGKLLPIHK